MKLKLLLLALTLSLLAAATAMGASPDYRQPVWFTWETSKLDVLIIPPEHGQIYNGNGVLGGGDVNELTLRNSYLRATKKAAADWKRAVARFGQSWLRQGLKISVYVVGLDKAPLSALQNPEIIVASSQTKGPILGITFSTRPCLIDNSKFYINSFTYEDMYNVASHEFGHCMGLDHTTGPAGNKTITHDVIYATYSDTPGRKGNHLHCVSNLNIKGVEKVFGRLFRQPSGGVATISPAHYARISC